MRTLRPGNTERRHVLWPDDTYGEICGTLKANAENDWVTFTLIVPRATKRQRIAPRIVELLQPMGTVKETVNQRGGYRTYTFALAILS
jgi:hypothetical protein